MDIVSLRQLERIMSTPQMLDLSVEYLTEKLRAFLRPGEKIMIYFAPEDPYNVGDLLTKAAEKLGAIPILPNGDYRWKSMLMTAFRSRATAIAAPPFVVLGLTKLACFTRTPLYFRNVLTAGYRCTNWMVEGIQRGLDCQVWRCFGPGSVLVGGFSCLHSDSPHIRDDVFRFDIVDDNENPVSDGENGYIMITPKCQPSFRYHTLERARLDSSPCRCGSSAPILKDLRSGSDVDPMMEELGRELMSWTSILDCKFRKGECGFEMELVVFPGEKLPKLPTCAKQIIRGWDPEKDSPFWFLPNWRNTSENS